MGGLDISLFRRLSDAHPEAVVDLTHQYRMNKEIMLLSNRLIYSNRLRCGTEAVATQSLKLPNVKFLETLHANSPCCRLDCWLGRLTDERSVCSTLFAYVVVVDTHRCDSSSCKAVFIDTDNVPAKESKVGDLVENVTEAQIVYQITECMLDCGAEENQIGIISLYRQQLKLLSHLFRDRKGLEILTADRSQGRDKDCIIISLVRSNDEGNVRLLYLCYPPLTKANVVVVAWGPCEGLAEDERVLHPRPFEAHHHRFSEDAAEGAVARAVL